MKEVTAHCRRQQTSLPSAIQSVSHPDLVTMPRRVQPLLPGVWDSAEAFVIDLVVEQLQKTKRWHRDGPSLRLLNKHWKQRLNESILTIRPRMRSGVSSVKPNSLLQFQRMTHLDTTNFHWTVDDSESLCNIIAQLSSLRRLSLSENELNDADISSLAPLTCLTALRIDACGLGIKSFLSKLACLSLKTLSITCDGAELTSIMRHLPTLQTLDLTLSAPATLENISMLRSLHTLHVRWTETSLYYASILRGLTSLVSLHLPDAPRGFDWESLTRLSKLKYLAFTVYPGQTVEPQAFLPLMSKLDSLDVDYQGIRQGMADTFVQGPAPLKTLRLKKFKIASATLNHLMCITQLNLVSCTVVNFSWLSSLKQLERMHLKLSNFREIVGFFKDSLNHGTLPHLTVLTVGSIPQNLVPSILISLSQLRKLKVLGIKLQRGNSLHKLFALEHLTILNHLTELKELGIFGSIFLAAISRMPRPHFVSLIFDLDALWVETASSYRMVTSVLDGMGHRPPALKIFAGSKLYKRFMAIHYPGISNKHTGTVVNGMGC